MNTFKTVAAITAMIFVAGCADNSRIENLEGIVAAHEARLLVATTTAEKAEATANQAMAEAIDAKKVANDAVEAVSRMAEKCCRK